MNSVTVTIQADIRVVSVKWIQADMLMIGSMHCVCPWRVFIEPLLGHPVLGEQARTLDALLSNPRLNGGINIPELEGLIHRHRRTYDTTLYTNAVLCAAVLDGIERIVNEQELQKRLER